MGIEGDPDRHAVMTGSPQWYIAYLATLCVTGVVVAMLHDDEAPRRPLRLALAGCVLVAVATVVLAATTGVDETWVNPLPSGMS
jgi:hypothetical protein